MQPLCDSLRTNGAQVTESINTFSKRISAWSQRCTELMQGLHSWKTDYSEDLRGQVIMVLENSLV